MATFFKRVKKFFLRKTVIAVIVILIIIIFFAARSGAKAPAYQTATATVGNVIEQVSVTGTVSPVSSADLAFEKGGVVETIDVAVGDHVRLKIGES